MLERTEADDAAWGLCGSTKCTSHFLVQVCAASGFTTQRGVVSQEFPLKMRGQQHPTVNRIGSGLFVLFTNFSRSVKKKPCVIGVHKQVLRR